MAYVLGFFAADGYITVNRRGGQFWSIQIVDKELVENIRRIVASEHKITVRFGSGKERTSYRLQIGSIEMCNDLRRLGMRERKTRSLVVPNIPDNYFSDFVRGYFDGDGNVWKGLLHKDRKKRTFAIYVMFTSCSFKFLKLIHLKLQERGLRGGSIYRAKGNYFRLLFSSNDSMKLYEFMYNKSENGIFLARKKVVFEKYVILKNAAVV